MTEDISCDRGKDVTLFQRGQIIKAKKTTKETDETNKVGLRAVQRIIKTWKESGEPSSSRRKCGWKKIT